MSLLEPHIDDLDGVGESGSSPDTGMWEEKKVPLGNLWNANEDYFFYHHTHGKQSQYYKVNLPEGLMTGWGNFFA